MTIRDLIRLIPLRYRPVLRRCMALAFVKGLLNLVGFAMFIPVLFLFLRPESIMGNATIMRFTGLLGVNSEWAVMLLCCCVILLVIVIKNLLLVLINRSQNAVYVDLMRIYSERLFRSYMSRDMLFFKDHSSGALTSNVCLASYTFVFNIIAPSVSMVSEGLLILLVVVLTAFVNIYIVLVLLLFILPVALLYKRLLRDGLTNLGREEYRLRRNQIRIVQESFKGYAEVTVNNAVSAIFDRYDRDLMEHAAIKKRIENRTGAVSGVLEVVVMFLLVALVAVTRLLDMDQGSLALVLGIIGFALIKIVGSIRTIVNNFTMIKTNSHTLEIMEQEGVADGNPTARARDRMAFESAIVVEGLRFSYDGRRDVLSDLSFTIHKGESVGVRGVSGAGKSTLFHLLLGLYRPTSGNILIDGEPLEGDNVARWQNRVGFVSQDVFISDSTIADNIMLGDSSCPPDRERLDYAIEMASLTKFVQSLPEGVDTAIGEAGSKLSGGLKQRIGIARALYKRADVLFFDEATSSLDSVTEGEIMESIDRLSESVSGLTILIIAHNESTFAGCGRIIEV